MILTDVKLVFKYPFADQARLQSFDDVDEFSPLFVGGALQGGLITRLRVPYVAPSEMSFGR